MVKMLYLVVMIVLPLILNLLVTPILIVSIISIEEYLKSPFYYTYVYGFIIWSIYHVFLAYLAYYFLKIEGESLRGIIGPVKEGLSVVTILGLLGLSILMFQIMEPIVSNAIYGSEWWMQFISEIRGIPISYILYGVLITSLTAGICEEIVWRGYIQTRLEHRFKGRTGIAVTIQAILFGLWHFISIHTVFTAVFGFIAGLIYAKTRRLTSIMIAHWLGDAIGFSMLYLIIA